MRILIAGGGIAGLSAAIGLLQSGRKDIEVVLLEKDVSQSARIQGYTLGVSRLGAKALQDISLATDLISDCTHVGRNVWVGKSNGSKLIRVGDTSSNKNAPPPTAEENIKSLLDGKMCINRGILRERMLEEIFKFENAKIHWGAKLVDMKLINNEPSSEKDDHKHNRMVQATVENGKIFTCDVLLGCDGIFSSVRELLPTCIPGTFPPNPPLRHLGVAWVRGCCREKGQVKHWIDDGSFLVVMSDTSGNVFIAECDRSGGTICWFFAFKIDAEEQKTRKRIEDREEICQEVYKRIKDSWHPCVKQIVQDTVTSNGPLLFRHLLDRTPDDIENWKVPVPGIPITLLGDAFHPVASYAMAGGGSNALSDGVAVAKELLDCEGDIATALRRYEDPIRERSILQAQKSQTNTSRIHSGWLGGYCVQMIFFILTPILRLLGKIP